MRGLVRSAAIAAVMLLLGAAPLDSQIVLTNYARALDAVSTPKLAIFSYAVSQAGPSDIEQRHRVYRSGSVVRDETLMVDGATPKATTVTIGRRTDRYAIGLLAPRAAQYEFLFVRAEQSAGHIDYVYDVTPIAASGGGFVVTHVTIDGTSFLPRSIAFRASTFATHGDGEVRYAPTGGYWMPVLATIAATVGGNPARERIAFGEYRFPPSLPPSTFIKR